MTAPTMSRYAKDSFVDAGSLGAFKPILESWIEVQRKYARAMWNEDQAWWYRERPCVGFLAAAAWQAGGVSLEEWQTRKGPRKQSHYGRCDLYICHRQQEFHIEAKHAYSRATGNAEREFGLIRARLDRAVGDAAKLQCQGSRKLGILFVVPFYLERSAPESIHDHITGWLQAVEGEVPHDAMAWLYEPRHKPVFNEGKCSPGIVLLARRPRR